MLGSYVAYSRLKPVAVRLPRRLAQAFGPGERYTVLQVKRARRRRRRGPGSP
jgi:hypothetical protein